MFDSILVNCPVASPLHPQLNLPLLKGYLQERGYKVRVIDSNIQFYKQFLSNYDYTKDLEEARNEPLKVLNFYNTIEQKLFENSKAYEGLQVGLRSLGMKHDRIYFDSVLNALVDTKANPFIEFYTNLVKNDIAVCGTKIVGIAVTFQDQIIPSFTLAKILRDLMPDVQIILGGQMITRCFKSMLKDERIKKLADYYVLWDGEMPFEDLHKKIIRGESIELGNTIEVATGLGKVERTKFGPNKELIPIPDYSDLNFADYIVPEVLIPMQTTRGCYAACAFCAIPFGSNAYKIRTVDRILIDIEKAQEQSLRQTGKMATYFKFMEDTSSPKLLFELAVEIEKRKLDVKWETFARLEKMFTLDGFMEQLYRGGCRKIHWGLESNDPDILVNMNKKNEMSYSTEILRLGGEAGILNFVFILVGFPGESEQARKAMLEYIINNKHIHTLTLATFDLTLGSPMAENFEKDNVYKLDCLPAVDFQVRLPYTVNGLNWKEHIIKMAHQMMIDIIKGRPDIGFMTLFPDQIRAYYCDKYGNDWGRKFVEMYGEDSIKGILLNAEKYANDFAQKNDIDEGSLPEPIRREHLRTKEDLELIAKAFKIRRDYESHRFNQV